MLASNENPNDNLESHILRMVQNECFANYDHQHTKRREIDVIPPL